MSIVVPFPRTNSRDTPDEQREDAEPACADRDPEWWFDESQYRRGQRVCRGCALRRQCLDQALASGERLGVWGGLTPAQRLALPDAVVVPLRPRRW